MCRNDVHRVLVLMSACTKNDTHDILVTGFSGSVSGQHRWRKALSLVGI